MKGLQTGESATPPSNTQRGSAEFPDRTPRASSGRFVQFYEDDAYLVRSVAQYIGSGLGCGGNAIVIATPEHRAGIEAHFRANGFDLTGILTRRQLVMLDAEETLSLFMRDGRPVVALFDEFIGESIREATVGDRVLFVYGEMGALLNDGGSGEAAMQLEGLWSGLAQRYRYSRLWAYPLHGSETDTSGTLFEQVSNEQPHILPSDIFKADFSAVEQLRTISQLKNHAKALHSEIRERERVEDELRTRTQNLQVLQHVVGTLAAEQDLDKIVQAVTDAGCELSGAAFGAFFYNLVSGDGESYMLYTLSGAPAEAFSQFPMPRNTEIFGPTFAGDGVVRLDDVTTDPRYGRNAPYTGMPPGHLPVKSYLAAPVISKSGDVVGGLFFGNSQPGVFTENSEELIVALAAHAAIAIENAKLREAVDRELEALARASLELASSRDELELRVEERTASLREAVGQMEEFSYTVSHDLRAPLRAMKVHCQLLLEDYGEVLAAEPQVLTSVLRISENATRLDKMVRDVLAYGRIARDEILLEPVSLDTLVFDTISHYPHLQPPLAEIQVAHLGNVRAHEPSLTQVLSNLLTNAVKFVPPGRKPQVSLRSEKIGDRRRLWIEDNGIGIDPRYHHRLFAMFERIHPDLPYEGTGVGLAIVKKAAERMGGGVGVESDGENGSRFWVELPLVS